MCFEPITLEMLMHGLSLPLINIIPKLHSCSSQEYPDWIPNLPNVEDEYEKLRKVLGRLQEIYRSEFLGNLIQQAVSTKGRYKPVLHKRLDIGDIVLMKEKHLKPNQYPMAIVRSITSNVKNEVTSVIVQKGLTRELLKRHMSSLVPLLSAASNHS